MRNASCLPASWISLSFLFPLFSVDAGWTLVEAGCPLHVWRQTVLLQIYDKTRKICWQPKTERERTVPADFQPFLPQRIYIWVFYLFIL